MLSVGATESAAILEQSLGVFAQFDKISCTYSEEFRLRVRHCAGVVWKQQMIFLEPS